MSFLSTPAFLLSQCVFSSLSISFAMVRKARRSARKGSLAMRAELQATTATNQQKQMGENSKAIKKLQTTYNENVVQTDYQWQSFVHKTPS